VRAARLLLRRQGGGENGDLSENAIGIESIIISLYFELLFSCVHAFFAARAATSRGRRAGLAAAGAAPAGVPWVLKHAVPDGGGPLPASVHEIDGIETEKWWVGFCLPANS
jgi:hypothetical protein